MPIFSACLFLACHSQTGDIIQRATNDIDTIRRFNTGVLLEFVRTILMLIVGSAIMFTIDTTLASITLGMLVPVFLTSVLFFRWINKLNNELEQTEGELFTVMQENLTGIRVVRAFGRSALRRRSLKPKTMKSAAGY
jgi:ATP-binding cassette subfamily B protein